MQLFPKANTTLLCIVPYPIDTDIQFSTYRLPFCRQRKRDNIGEIIMLQKIVVHDKQCFIGTENDVDVFQLLFFGSKQLWDKILK